MVERLLTFDEWAALAAFVAPLLSVCAGLTSGRRSRRPTATTPAVVGARAADYSFDELMQKFREADSEHNGLEVASLDVALGAGLASRIRAEMAENDELGARQRLCVADFVPLACCIAASPTKAGLKQAAAPNWPSQAGAWDDGAVAGESLPPRHAQVTTHDPEHGRHSPRSGAVLDVHDLAYWLAQEHLRVLNVVLLSNAGEAPRSTTSAAAKAVIAAEESAPVSLDGLQLCIQLFLQIRALALTGDVETANHVGAAAASSATDDDTMLFTQLQHSAALEDARSQVQDALVAGELTQRVERLLHSPLSPGPKQLIRLQMELRAVAAAAARATIEGLPLPHERAASLWRTLRPSSIRRAMMEYYQSADADVAIVTKEAVLYTEQLAMLYNALANTAEDASADDVTRAILVSDAAAEAQMRSDRYATARIDRLVRRVLCVPMPCQNDLSLQGRQHPSIVAPLSPVKKAMRSSRLRFERVWFVVPPEAEWLLASPRGAAALLQAFVGLPHAAASEEALRRVNAVAAFVHTLAEAPPVFSAMAGLLSLVCRVCGGALNVLDSLRAQSTPPIAADDGIQRLSPSAPTLAALASAAAFVFTASSVVALLAVALPAITTWSSSAHTVAGTSSVLLGVLIQPLLLQAWWYTHPAWPAGSEDNTSSQRAPFGVAHLAFLLRVRHASIRNLASKYMQPSEQLAAAALGYRADGSNDPKQADMPELRSLLLAPVALQFGLGSADDAEARMARDSSTHGQPWASAFGAMQRKDGGATSSLTGAFDAAAHAAIGAAGAYEALAPALAKLSGMLEAEASLIAAVDSLKVASTSHHGTLYKLQTALATQSLQPVVSNYHSARDGRDQARGGLVPSPAPAAVSAHAHVEQGMKPVARLADAYAPAPVPATQAYAFTPASATTGTVPPLTVATPEDESQQEDPLDSNEEDGSDSSENDETPLWYYAVDATQQGGPISVTQLGALRAHGQLPSETLVWCAGLDGWHQLVTLPDLMRRVQEAEDHILEAEIEAEEAELAPWDGPDGHVPAAAAELKMPSKAISPLPDGSRSHRGEWAEPSTSLKDTPGRISRRPSAI